MTSANHDISDIPAKNGGSGISSNVHVNANGTSSSSGCRETTTTSTNNASSKTKKKVNQNQSPLSSPVRDNSHINNDHDPTHPAITSTSLSKSSKKAKKTSSITGCTSCNGGCDEAIATATSSSSYFKSTKRFIKKSVWGSSKSKKEKQSSNTHGRHGHGAQRNSASSNSNSAADADATSSQAEQVLMSSQQEEGESGDNNNSNNTEHPTITQSPTTRMRDKLLSFNSSSSREVGHGVMIGDNNMTAATSRSCVSSSFRPYNELRPVARQAWLVSLAFSAGCTCGSYTGYSGTVTLLYMKYEYEWTMTGASRMVSAILGILWLSSWIMETRRRARENTQTVSQTRSLVPVVPVAKHVYEGSSIIKSATDAKAKRPQQSQVESESASAAAAVVRKGHHNSIPHPLPKTVSDISHDTGDGTRSTTKVDPENRQVQKRAVSPPAFTSSLSSGTPTIIQTLLLSKPEPQHKPQLPQVTLLSKNDRTKQQHPDLLSKLFILTEKGTTEQQNKHAERIIPNSGTYVIDNEFMSGHMNLMLRTPDVDDNGKNSSTNNQLPVTNSITPTMAQRVSEHFRGKQRQFEFQFQFRFKKPPPGPLYMGFELDVPLKLGMIQRAFIKAALAAIRTINPFLHYSFGSSEEVGSIGSGMFEKTHLSFSLESSMDRIIVSKSSKDAPTLGGDSFELDEDLDSVRRRKKGVANVKWNMEDTYTIATWNAYASYLQWKALNLPGLRPFSFTNVSGEQPLNIVIYALHGDETTKCHYRKDIDLVMDLELFHKPTCNTKCAGRLYQEYKRGIRSGSGTGTSIRGGIKTSGGTTSIITEGGSIVTDTDADELGSNEEEESFFEDDDIDTDDSDDICDYEDADADNEDVVANAMESPIAEGMGMSGEEEREDASQSAASASTRGAIAIAAAHSSLEIPPLALAAAHTHASTASSPASIDAPAWIEIADRRLARCRLKTTGKHHQAHHGGRQRAFAIRMLKTTVVVAADDQTKGSTSTGTTTQMQMMEQQQPQQQQLWMTRLRTVHDLKEVMSFSNSNTKSGSGTSTSSTSNSSKVERLKSPR
jgi:hypothetical protein